MSIVISRTLAASVVAVGLVVIGSSLSGAQAGQEKRTDYKSLSGKIRIDGSSTVAPIVAAAAEMYRADSPRTNVVVGISGTGGGFKKFLETDAALRTDISNASRPIHEQELSRAKELGAEFIELPIAYDGIAIVVNPQNKFCEYLTVDELKRIWSPGSKIDNWKDVRTGFPDLRLRLFGPGADSGTFDYFTEAIVGKEDASRSDYTASENDNVLVRGVEGEAGALGYFGFSYFEANKARLKLVGVDATGGGAIKPSLATIRDHSYHPLSRPLFIYVARGAAERAEVVGFVEYLLLNAKRIVEHPRVNYVALPDELYQNILKRFREKITGTVYSTAERKTRPIAELYGGKP
ncbi:MAG: PstS family phosphate ABC transporter substrate-binding protein [Phycisphaerae bacterium]